MQNEFIDNLITYIDCSPERKDREKFITLLYKHQHHHHILLFLQKLHADLSGNFFDTLIKVLFLGLYAMSRFERKQDSADLDWGRIRRLEKDRKNIVPYINALKDSLEIYKSIKNEMLIKHTQIAILIFESFLKDDDLTIEKLSLAHFEAVSSHHSREYDVETGEYKYSSCAPECVITEDFQLRHRFREFIPEVEPLIKTIADLRYLGSLLEFFEGYRITPQMVLKSVAIKLYNYPFWINGHRDEKINKTALKQSIEDLLIPFSQTEKFTLDISKANHFYVKTYFHSSPILALAGKNHKGKFQSLFNPEKYYAWIKDDYDKYYLNQAILHSMFYTN